MTDFLSPIIHADGCSHVCGFGLFKEKYPNVNNELYFYTDKELDNKGYFEYSSFNRNNNYVKALGDILGINEVNNISFPGKSNSQLTYETIKGINEYKKKGLENVLFVIGLSRITINYTLTIYGNRGIFGNVVNEDDFHVLISKIRNANKPRFLLNSLHENIIIVKYLYSELKRSGYPFIITISDVCNDVIDEILNGKYQRLFNGVNKTYLNHEFLKFHEYVEYFDVKKPKNKIDFLLSLKEINFEKQTKSVLDNVANLNHPGVNKHKHWAKLIHKKLIEKYSEKFSWIK